MKIPLLAISALALVSLTACSDPEKEANVIFVDAANEIQAARNLPAWDRLQAYMSASQKIESLKGNEYKGTQASLKAASEEKIGGLSFNELIAEISSLRESKEICAVERTENCLHRLIMAGAEKDIVVSSEEQFHTIAMLASRLELAGRHTEAEAFKNKILAALPGSVTKAQFLEGYAAVMASSLKPASKFLDETDLTAYYELVWDWLNENHQLHVLDRVIDDIIIEFDTAAYPNFVRKIIEGTTDPIRKQEIAVKAIHAMTWDTAGTPSKEDFLFIAEFVADKLDAFERYAKLGEQQRKEVLALVEEKEDRKRILRKAFEGAYKIPPSERLRLVEEIGVDALQDKANSILIFALEGQENKALSLRIIDDLSLAPDTVTFKLKPIVQRFISDGVGLEDLISLALKSISSDPDLSKSKELCSTIARMLAATQSGAYFPNLAEACLPVYEARNGLHEYAAMTARLDLLYNAGQVCDEVQYNKVFGTLRNALQLDTNIYFPVKALLERDKFDTALELARTAAVKEDEIAGIYSQLLTYSINNNVGDSMELWEEAVSKTDAFKPRWLPNKPNDIDANLSKFISRLIDTHPEAFIETLLSIREDARLIDPFAVIDSPNLAKLAKVADAGVRNDVGNVVALRHKGTWLPEEEEAVWTLPDDKLNLALRIATIKLSEKLRNYSNQTTNVLVSE